MPHFQNLILFDDLIFNSPELKEVRQLADRISESALSVFVHGEKGTGFFQLARYIHQKSDRADRPLIYFNPEKLSHDAQKRELFGDIIRGFYYPGKLELANGGTLLIDPVEAIDTGIQYRLFRALNTREFEVGETGRIEKTDFRIISGSRFSTGELSESLLFRQDLLFRIEGVPLELPSLRQRGADILNISQRMADKICAVSDIPVRKFSHTAIQSLLAYSWPGNLEELFTVLDKALLVQDRTEIDGQDLISPVSNQLIHRPQVKSTDIFSMDNNRIITLDEAREFLFRKALKMTGGNVEKAAELIGISRATAFRMHQKKE
ncbi:MAG: sigma 54-interacting transcriptional regulator [Bacteroidetes bacterium]|nr:sigma 54-interacting transcriptional regulator [Bacteroidota bacterium]